MTDLLLNVHPWLGYLVTVVVLVAALLGPKRAKDAREFVAAPYAAPLVLLDVHVLLGIVLYGLTSSWDARPEIAYLHPVLALAALGVGHAVLGRARRHQMAADAHRTASRGLLLTLVLVLFAIGVASAPAFL